MIKDDASCFLPVEANNCIMACISKVARTEKVSYPEVQDNTKSTTRQLWELFSPPPPSPVTSRSCSPILAQPPLSSSPSSRPHPLSRHSINNRNGPFVMSEQTISVYLDSLQAGSSYCPCSPPDSPPPRPFFPSFLPLFWCRRRLYKRHSFRDPRLWCGYGYCTSAHQPILQGGG